MPRELKRVAEPGDYIVTGDHRASFYLYEDGGDDRAVYWDVLELVKIGLSYKDEFFWAHVQYSRFEERQDATSTRPPTYMWFISAPQDVGGGRYISVVKRIRLADNGGGLLSYGEAVFYSRTPRNAVRSSEVKALKKLLAE
jgi:hypothetical protein